ncbi:MAG: hypothetical protein Phog2KO_34390 [Phototrophicaceae bacterium]
MAKKKQKRTFKRPLTDVMTHGVIWLLLSIAFFILNFYAQSALNYTLADPQIYQFILAPIIWGLGLGLHTFVANRLNNSSSPMTVSRSLRHKFRDIHIGVFVAFFMMLFSLGLTGEIVGTGALDVLSTLTLLLPWASIVAVHSWIVRIIDQRKMSSDIIHEDDNIDISRLIDKTDSDEHDASRYTANSQKSRHHPI